MHLPKTDLRLDPPNPADNAPGWEGTEDWVRLPWLRGLERPRPVVVPDVEAALWPPAGAVATFRDATGAVARLTAANRVSLVYFLADAVAQDRRDGVDEEEVGWRSNRKASVAVWGRIGADDPRRLKSLVFNVRSELRAAGIDPRCIDKRRGAVRLRALEVRLG